MENTDIQQTQLKSIQKLRNNAEEERKKRIKNIVTHREILLKELFTMTGEGSNSLETDHVLSFLKGGDVTQVDQDKWGAYLDKHKISNVKSNMIKQESTSPNSENSDPLKKLSRRLPPPPVRMVTRGVSGAVRPKSVDEILSSLDQKDTSSTEKSSSPTYTSNKSSDQVKTPARVTTISSPHILMDLNSKDPSTIVYNGVKLSAGSPNTKIAKQNEFDLYAWQLHANHFPLYKQLQTARKTLTTHDWMLARDELKSVKSIQKIETLKKNNLWSLRQLKRHKAARRVKTHWDSMLDEMKWMQTDFKEERKWKMAMAFMTARAVMEWHNTDDKSKVCVKTRIPEPIELVPTAKVIDAEVSFVDSEMTEVEESEIENSINQELIPGPELVEESPIIEATTNTPLKTDAMMGTDITTDAILSIDTNVMNGIENNKNPITATTPEESSMPPTPKLTATSLSSDIIQEYRNIIKDFDPNMPILTLSVETFGEFDASALFPDVLTYEPPNPAFNDVYFDESEYGKVTPISKLVAQRIALKAPRRYNRKRDIDGNPIVYADENKSYKSDIKQLPRHERYDPTPLISPLFAPKRLKDSPAQQPFTPQNPTNFQSVVTHWSEDDDVCLISFIIQYSFNWDLICDALNSVRLPITGVKRTPWECHDRWKRNNLTSLSGQVSSAYTSKLKRELNRRPATVRFDTPSKRQRQYNIFEAIKKTQKKREESEKNSTTSNIAPPRPTIEVHGTNSSGQRLPTAMEMSMHKAQRERQMAQAVLEQRQLSAAISLGSQAPTGAVRSVTTPTAQATQQQARPMAVSSSTAAQARVTPTTTTATVPNAVRPPTQLPITQQNNALAAGLPLNRYPAAQLQLLRQQQMVLMAAAQQQAQQQAAQQAAQQNNGQARPNNVAGNQRFATAIQTTQAQQAQQQQLQQLQLQQAQVIAQQQAQLLAAQQLAQQQQQPQSQQQQQALHTPAPSAETVAQQVSQMTTPTGVQQSPQQQRSQTTPQSSPQSQNQQQQAAIAAQLHAAQANPLMFAAQLAQMGYPISQLPANQQLQLQRYLAQLQMRNAAVAAATAASVGTNSNNGGSPVQQQQPGVSINNGNNLQAALLAQQQLQRLQQAQQAQQVLQMQQQQQQQAQQQQPSP